MNQQSTEIYKAILEILKKYTDPNTLNKLTPESTINGDIGLQGDDAYLFLKEVVEKWQVRTDEFKFEKYFVSEGGPVNIFRPQKYKHAEKELLRIDSLIENIVSGSLK